MRHISSRFSILTSLIVITVVSSIGLHSLQVPHDHPGGGAHYEREPHGTSGETLPLLGEYLHMAEKKFLLAIIGATLLSAFLAVILYGSWYTLVFHIRQRWRARFKQYRRTPALSFDYLVRCFCCGILHPKLH